METKNKVYEVRGVKVILDKELASTIGYETKVLNQLVKRNINKLEVKKNIYFLMVKYMTLIHY